MKYLLPLLMAFPMTANAINTYITGGSYDNDCKIGFNNNNAIEVCRTLKSTALPSTQSLNYSDYRHGSYLTLFSRYKETNFTLTVRNNDPSKIEYKMFVAFNRRFEKVDTSNSINYRVGGSKNEHFTRAITFLIVARETSHASSQDKKPYTIDVELSGIGTYRFTYDPTKPKDYCMILVDKHVGTIKFKNETAKDTYNSFSVGYSGTKKLIGDVKYEVEQQASFKPNYKYGIILTDGTKLPTGVEPVTRFELDLNTGKTLDKNAFAVADIEKHNAIAGKHRMILELTCKN